VGSPDEQVLVVPRASVIRGEGWLGLRADGLEATLEAVRTDGFFMRRGDAEDDPTHKQVIPYLVLRDGHRWFLMRRTRAGGDARLHDLWSIGVGGHLNPGDGDVEGGLRREWAEEVVADFEPDFEPVGLLNDDTTPVGAVHLGVVFVADAGGRAVTIREVDKLTGAFATTDDVAAVRDAMETWSRLVFDALTEPAAESP
jgi:predicted NUDIX family phosphoesterase